MAVNLFANFFTKQAFKRNTVTENKRVKLPWLGKVSTTLMTSSLDISSLTYIWLTMLIMSSRSGCLITHRSIRNKISTIEFHRTNREKVIGSNKKDLNRTIEEDLLVTIFSLHMEVCKEYYNK